LICPIVEVGEEKRLGELSETENAADDVLAHAVDDAEAEGLWTDERDDQRLQRYPTVAALEIRDRPAQKVHARGGAAGQERECAR